MTVKMAIAVLAGGFAAQHSRVLISWDQCLPILVAIGLLIYLRRLRIVAAFLGGFFMMHVAASYSFDQRLDPQFAGDSMLVVVRVVDFPDVNAMTTTMMVAPVDDSRLPPRSRVSWYQAPVKPALGDVWELELRLRRPRGAANPGGFDAERWMFRERIHAMGYVVPGKRNRLLQSPDLGPVDRVRARFVRESRVISDVRGIVAAVAVGARQDIDPERWQRFAQTGTSHLVAISGLHVGLAAISAFGVVYLISVVAGIAGNHFQNATVGAVALAFAYATVSGLGIPAQRATLMLALGAVAVITGRQVRPVHLLTTSALIVFVFDPVSLMAPGFALSFGAVLLLYRVAADFRPGSAWAAYLPSLWAAQLVLFFGLLPLTDQFFGRVALSAPIVNIVVVPIFSLLTVPASLAAIVAVACELTIAEACLRLAAIGVRIVEAVVDAASGLPVSGSTITKRDGFFVLVPWLTLLWVILPRGWPGRLLAPLAIVVLLQSDPDTPQSGCFDLHVLDVGQGQSVVVRTARHTLVYDTGPRYRSGSSAAEYVLLPFLEYLGVQEVDWLVVSHGDLDHAGGVAHLVEGIDVSRLFMSEPPQTEGLNAFHCRSGQSWRADGVEFKVLHPVSRGLQAGNNGSCVIEVAAGRKRLLLTGDIETEAENSLLERGVVRRSHVVTVPHHGSQTSSGPAFINHIDPEIVIASTGYGNRWNFPSERVRLRWEGAGARFYDTGASGAISISVCRWRAPRSVREGRYERRKFWHDDVGPQ